MKASFCMHRDWFATMPELVNLVAELKYDAVEIWSPAIEAIGFEKVVERLTETGLKVCSFNAYFSFAESEETMLKSLVEAGMYIEMARRVSSPYIRVCTSKVASTDWGSADATEEQWQRAIKGFRAVCSMAAQHGITCLMEVHHGDSQLYDTTPATLRLIREVGADNLKVNLQVPLFNEDFYESAEKLGPYTIHVHANNNKESWGNFCNLDEGNLDFERFMSILVRHGFNGYVSVEHAMRDPMGVAKYEISYLRYLFNKLSPDKPAPFKKGSK